MMKEQDETLPTGWCKAPLSGLLTFVIGGDWGQAPDYADADYVPVLCIRASEVRNWKTKKEIQRHSENSNGRVLKLGA